MYVHAFMDGNEEIESLQERITGRYLCEDIVDKDGNVIFVYHARPTSHNYQMCGWDGTKSTYNSEPLNDPCRHARLKRVHWSTDGTPWCPRPRGTAPDR